MQVVDEPSPRFRTPGRTWSWLWAFVRLLPLSKFVVAFAGGCSSTADTKTQKLPSRGPVPANGVLQ